MKTLIILIKLLVLLKFKKEEQNNIERRNINIYSFTNHLYFNYLFNF